MVIWFFITIHSFTANNCPPREISNSEDGTYDGQAGKSITVVCMQGYNVDSETPMTCGMNGQWESSVACIGKEVSTNIHDIHDLISRALLEGSWYPKCPSFKGPISQYPNFKGNFLTVYVKAHQHWCSI